LIGRSAANLFEMNKEPTNLFGNLANFLWPWAMKEGYNKAKIITA
jgi:hypothetical protein